MDRARLLWRGTLIVVLGAAAGYFFYKQVDFSIVTGRTSSTTPHVPAAPRATEEATRQTRRPRATALENALAARAKPPSPATHRPENTPASPSEPPAAARAAESAAGDEEIPRDLLRDLLHRTIQEKLPERDLSADDVERLTDAVLRIRAARRALRQLPLTRRNAAEIRRWQESLDAALSDFQTVAEMSAADFTRLADPGAGLTEGGDDDAVVHEPLDNYPPPD